MEPNKYEELQKELVELLIATLAGYVQAKETDD